MSDVTKVEITEPREPEDEAGKAELAAERAARGEKPGDEEEFELDSKFTSVKELQEAYHELQRKQSAKSGETTTEEGGKPRSKLEIGEGEPETPAGLDVEKYTKEVMANGDLSAESRAELTAKGIPDAMIESHLAGLRALAEQAENTLIEVAGGEERWGQIQKWAASNLSAEEKKALNSELQSGDSARALLAMRGLASRFGTSSAGQEGVEGPTGGPSVQPFKSTQEMLAAMADPRYQDPSNDSYRKEVEARLRVSEGVGAS